jgi:Cu/Ag efflux protein CusF
MKFMLAGIATLILISSGASAEQALTGTVTEIDRIDGTIAIRQTQNGTVGANSGGPTEAFKAQDGVALDDVHAGDKVTASTTEVGGVKTITKLQKQ